MKIDIIKQHAMRQKITYLMVQKYRSQTQVENIERAYNARCQESTF